MRKNSLKAGMPDLFPGFGATPGAVARVVGDTAHAALRGTVRFYPAGSGTLMVAEFRGLPYDAAHCAENIFAMHIHAGGSCAGDGGAFSAAGGHFDPSGCSALRTAFPLFSREARSVCQRAAMFFRSASNVPFGK